MWTWIRRIAAVGALGLLSACCGGGGDEGCSASDEVAARAGEAPISVEGGGSVDAVLEGGTTLKIDIPAGAVTAPATLRIEPVDAAAGSLGGFRFTPADLALTKPATVTLTWAGGDVPPANVVLAVQRDGQPVAISPAMQGAQLTFEVTSLGKLPAVMRDEAPAGAASAGMARAQAKSGPPALAATGDPGEAEAETMHLVPMTPDQRLEALRRLVDAAYSGSGTVAFALDVQAAFDAYVRDPQTDRASPALQRVAWLWENVICPQYTHAVSALETYNGSEGVVFERRVRPVVIWGRVLRDFVVTGTMLSPRVFGTCVRPDGFSFAPVIEKLPGFIEAVEAATRTVGFDQIIDDELPPLIRVEEMLRYVGIHGRMLSLLNLLTGQLRDLANESCRNGQGQDHHQKLLARVLGDAGFVAAAPYNAIAVKDDIQRCGMRLSASPLDANGRSTQTIRNLGASARPTEVLMTRVQMLRIEADRDKLRALQCPAGTSANNEQLVFEAGVPAQGMTELSRISASNENSYLEQPQAMEFDAARLAELRDPATQTTTLRIRRAGGLCNGAFPEITEHVVLVELNLVFGVETWSGTISGTYQMSVNGQATAPVQPRGDGTSTGPGSSASNKTQSLSGTWNVTVDVVAGRAVALRVLSADGTATASYSYNAVLESNLLLGCRRIERWADDETGNGSARVEGSQGTLWIDNGRFALDFTGAFAGIREYRNVQSGQEIMAGGPCHNGNQSWSHPQSGAGPASWTLGTANAPLMGDVGNGVISGSETRNLTPEPNKVGEVPTGSRVLTMTWNLRRE